MLIPGSIVAGRFRIERILGQGGMGVVAVATHLELDQRVAIKVLHETGATDPAALERFAREARSAAKLRSEHACRVFDVGRLEDGAPFIVMELLEGVDLAALVARGPLPVATAVDHVLAACIAVAEAHAAGIVHRDLKPANLFLTRRVDGSPLIKVLDFGIAKAPAAADAALTRTQALMGSPGYMSPEQLRSPRDVDARSDLWSLGVILYELVSGRVPFPAETLTELAVKIAMDPPLPVDSDPAFAAVVFRCLEKAPRDRYRNVADLAIALVPFGGPQAAAVAESIQRLAGPMPDAHAATLAVADRNAPTASSLAGSRSPSPTTTLQSGATAVQTTPPPPQRRMSWTAVAIAGLAATVLIVAIVARSARSPQVIDTRGSSTDPSAQAIAIPLAVEIDDPAPVTSPPVAPPAVLESTPAAVASPRAKPAATKAPAKREKPGATRLPANRVTSRPPSASASSPAATAAPAVHSSPDETTLLPGEPDDELVASIEAALRDGHCDVADKLATKLTRRTGNRSYSARVRTCVAQAPKEKRVEWYVAEAQSRAGYDTKGTLQYAEAALAEDPRNARAAWLAVYSACYEGDAAKAQKYVPLLTQSRREDAKRTYQCQLLNLRLD